MQSEQLVNGADAQSIHWRSIYAQHLAQSLAKTSDYVQSSESSIIRSHVASMLTLLEESIPFPELKEIRLRLIDQLHPLPLRWGLSHLWKSRMLEIINDGTYSNRQNRYLVDLAEFYLYSGQMPLALESSARVLRSTPIGRMDAADAIRVQFTALRTMAEPEKADSVYREYGEKFNLFQERNNYSGDDLIAWVKFHLMELEILREKGKTDEALTLVNQMITLYEEIDDAGGAFSAELHVHRSTLLWVKARYPESIQDLEIAIRFYLQNEDLFNAESLKSNLGLVYWTMGEFAKAQKSLSEAITFYQKCGADHLMAYDIGNLGLVYFAQGNLEQAKQKTLEHIEFSDRIGFATESYRGHANLADILYYFGQFEQAIDEHDLVDDYFRERGSREGYQLGKVWSASCRAKLGEVDKAITELNTILEWCSHHQSRVLEALTHRALALWLPLSERASHLRQSLNLARAQGRQLEEAACLLMLAREMVDPKQQKETWSAGVQILERIGATAWLEGSSIDNPPFIPMFI
jgi:tetratricopeptide (TPR) repeat protein